MFDLIREHQLDFMLVMIGICAIISFFVLITAGLTRKRRIILLVTELSATFLLIADRLAYIYRGDVGTAGYYMVRIANFVVFFTTLSTLGGFNLYLSDLFTHDGKLKKVPLELRVCNALFIIGEILIVISQFTGLYYTFDEFNRYQRAPLYIICYIIPMLILILQLIAVIRHRKHLSTGIKISIIVFPALCIISSIAQLKLYGLSLTNITIVAVVIMLYIFALIDTNNKTERNIKKEIENLTGRSRRYRTAFEQTAHAVAGIIDSRDEYSNGHSERVAKLSSLIASMAGKSKDECEQIYYAGLLHDIGKIKSDLPKSGKLDKEEYENYKKYTTEGGRILEGIEEYPMLAEAASHHHEWYDGTGYPDGLKGDKIPEAARIIAVADSYDSMTTRKSYRDRIYEQRVKEEFIVGSGTKYDPEYSRIMVKIIDEKLISFEDVNEDRNEDSGDDLAKIDSGAYREDISKGIIINENVSVINIRSSRKAESDGFSSTAIILFDSLDGKVHDTERAIKEYSYIEYGEIWFDGHFISTNARNIKVESDIEDGGKEGDTEEYVITTGRFEDHLSINISNGKHKIDVTVALPDNSRYSFLALTGENRTIVTEGLTRTGTSMNSRSIPRIAEEISYINRLESDLKNTQVDSFRSAYTSAVTVKDESSIEFHSMSLPTSSLVWHCPSVLLYYSDDMKVGGPNYREYGLIRFDGEVVGDKDYVRNKMQVVKTDDFKGWEYWKEQNKKGIECRVDFKIVGRHIITTTENLGISIKVTTVLDQRSEVYAALTGDMCALTDIRVINKYSVL